MTIHKILGQTFYLLPERAIFWKETEHLIIADLHLGKAGHFRKSGIPVSDLVHSKDVYLLDRLIDKHKPRTVVFLGDLFHSEENQSWTQFRQWLKSKSATHFQLVLGNHDILPEQSYRLPNLEVLEQLELAPFTLTHIPEDTTQYNLAGHIHPAVRLSGKGRQSLRLPCFYFGSNNGILPAFGQFTGTARIPITKHDDVYAITEDSVVKVC
ncbi:putative phosphoesterase [Roseivirga pacifica]|uniref:Putative phosphoesterase n=1 Tax=Roseivirga pacifica TaxID=1267423 RepID=A0A1I0QTI8_9BACT|nr:ligase-associated DNA damage response endonuclease PdeM [Roseivirga pacifica]RKQ42631.1 putative phosphoesterase [Roseivirga pacifica]SEW30249.1 putative phosphoesterase [Roseivirga pacifica]